MAFERYGPQWEAAMMRMTKKDLIHFAKTQGLRNQELAEINFDLLAQQRLEHETIRKAIKDLCEGKTSVGAGKLYGLVDPIPEDEQTKKQ